jgi:hypothetical protein
MSAPSYLNEHHAIVGMSGAGKTVTAKGEVEQLLRERRHIAIVDLTDAWWGLRSDVAGTGPGFDIPIFGGRKADVPVGPGDGDAIARLVIEQRISAIVSLAHMHDDADQRAFLAPFVKRLRAKPSGNFHLVVDEAEEVCPQTAPDDLAFALTRDMTWIAKRGRLPGFVLTIITQRPADVAKSVLSQSQTLIAHQLIDPRDQKAIDDYLKAKGDKQVRGEVMASLPSLERGERWIYSPRLDILERGRSPAISTFDSSRTPAPGEDYVEPKTLGQIDVSAIAAALKKPASGEAANRVPAHESGEEGLRLIEIEEQLGQKDVRIRELEAEREQLRRALLGVAGVIETYERAVRETNAALSRIVGQLNLQPADANSEVDTASERSGEGQSPPSPRDTGGGEAPAPGKRQGKRASPASDASAPDAAASPDREYRALAVLASVYPLGLTEAAWAARAGYSRKGGAWQRRKTRYVQGGLIEQREGRFFATEAGLDRAGEEPPEFPAPGPELVAFWAKRLGAAGRILTLLARIHPQTLTRGAIAEELRMSPKGGAFNRHVTAAKSAELVVERGKRLGIAPALVGVEP